LHIFACYAHYKYLVVYLVCGKCGRSFTKEINNLKYIFEVLFIGETYSLSAGSGLRYLSSIAIQSIKCLEWRHIVIHLKQKEEIIILLFIC